MTTRKTIRPGLIVLGLALLTGAGIGLSPQVWLGRAIPLDTPGTAFNLSILAEMRVGLALLGLGCLLIGLLGQRLLVWPGRLAPSLARSDKWLHEKHHWRNLVLLASLLAAFLLAAFSITRHNHFNSKAYDLGLHAQVWWNTAQGRFFASSVEVDNYLGDHVSPIILPLAPLYRLWPDARLLLLIQALALAAGALPLAALARRRLLPRWPEGAHLASLLLTLIYLSYPALGFVNRFEFHEEVLAVPLLLAAFWFLETKRPWATSAALLLAMLCKEDVGLTVAAFGLFAWYRRREWRVVGLAWAGIGLVWSLLGLFVIIPALRGGVASDTLGRYAWLGDNTAGMLAGLLASPRLLLSHLLGEPRRLWFLVKFLLPAGFLPLLSPAILIALPSLAINWLAGNTYQASIYFHYATLMIPIVFAAAVYGLEKACSLQLDASSYKLQANSLPTIILLWLLLCAALALAFDQPWQRQVGPADWENYGLAWQVSSESVVAFREAAARLPADASLATTEAYAPHLANRQGLYLLHDPRILQVAERVDWVLVDLNDLRYGVNPRLYYGLLRWIADRQGLAPCYFAADVVLLGPDCADGPAAAAYATRLAELQRASNGIAVDPLLIENLGGQYFVAE